MRDEALELRSTVLTEDRDVVRRLVTETGFFSAAEVAIAVELVDERLASGGASGYEFVFAKSGDQVVGFACWGEIPGTEGSIDVYWVVVDPRRQGLGIGRTLLGSLEHAATKAGGIRVFIDTSGRPQYTPTLEFYRRCGYTEVARIPDFYARGDPRVVFHKHLESTDEPLCE